ncbi:MAG: (Fe-S)-binding protein [Bacteroidales bacterium]|nr:(Fe-S)-binding protein [Bacteroidales bacterium]
MTFDLFVLPFFLGLITLLVILSVKYARWIKGFDLADRDLIRKGVFTKKSLGAAGEVFMESLLHRKMFRRNGWLGYMHMSFAFGWFLLIVCGNLESRIYSKVHINPPYYPIFLKFFVADEHILRHELMSIPGVFRLLMDMFLLLVLSGLVLALIKRASSHWFGLKKTTRHTFFDRLAITTLWLIFPLRLLAESFTAAHYHGGSFLTNNFGDLLDRFLPAQQLSYPAWWTYSLVLGGFFVSLPYSRFMHIPTEVMLIFFRHYGIKPTLHFNHYSNFEIQSCPKCGVCIDACPLHTDANEDGIPPAYFLRTLKNNRPDINSTYDCLLCGRCGEYCPVGININALRVSQRIRYAKNLNGSFTYLKQTKSQVAEIAYFAGCMTHLTPSIKISMEKIFTTAGVDYQFIDRDGSVCCGRPLWMAGKEKQARELMEHNKKLIESTNCKTLVLSCPICLKIFREEYNLNIEMLHHSQYLLRLVNEKKIDLKKEDLQVAFHDPCELGRGSGIFEEPRQLIRQMVNLVTASEEKGISICCGGSLGSTGINCYQRDKVSQLTLETLMANNPGSIITACPLCKKTLQKGSPVEVKDISELTSSLLYVDKSSAPGLNN